MFPKFFLIIKQKTISLSHILILISMLLICFACSKNGKDDINEKDIVNEEKVINGDNNTNKDNINENNIVDDIDIFEEAILNGVKCSDLGMIPNDNTKGAHNRNILIDALKNGTAILVDDMYYLSGTGNSTDRKSVV